MVSTARAVVIVTLCLSGVGCAALNVRKPTASVSHMSVGEVTPEAFTLDFAVDVSNPNGFALPLSAADYELGVGGGSLLKGQATPGESIPANGSLAVTVPVSVTFDRLLSAEQAIRDSGGDVPFDLSGGLSFDTGSPLAGRVRVPLHYAGTLPLKRILSDPQALLQSPAAKRLAAAVLGHFFGR
jgi:LEA14-like dessication related protein